MMMMIIIIMIGSGLKLTHGNLYKSTKTKSGAHSRNLGIFTTRCFRRPCCGRHYMSCTESASKHVISKHNSENLRRRIIMCSFLLGSENPVPTAHIHVVTRGSPGAIAHVPVIPDVGIYDVTAELTCSQRSRVQLPVRARLNNDSGQVVHTLVPCHQAV